MILDDQPILRGVQLSRSYGEGDIRTTALHQVSLDLYRGQFTLLMGPSGSGKSTLLAILSALLAPDSGQVLAQDGDRMVDVWALSRHERERYRLRNCGFIFQGYNLFPALTARQQLEIVLRWGNGLTHYEARKKSEEMLGELGLGKKLHLLPAQLSGGEKQRVAIGRALVKGPKYCFADEPTSALDWHHGEQVVEMLRSAAHMSGATVLVVSHDPRLKPFVDTTYHMEDGRLRSEEPAEPAGRYPLAGTMSAS
jgi:putative ABC transport system ATP-binding protein